MIKIKVKINLETALLIGCAVFIPFLLALYSIQIKRCGELQSDVVSLEEQEMKLVEENKALITNISMLSNSNRIERIASLKLGMHKADSNEIIRVEMEGYSR